ncbi:MAG: hypothetical protein ACR2LT_00900 [Pyrinomonadaceae bacterium]
MHKDEKIIAKEVLTEKPNAFWYCVYFAVVIVTILVISALWMFSY